MIGNGAEKKHCLFYHIRFNCTESIYTINKGSKIFIHFKYRSLMIASIFVKTIPDREQHAQIFREIAP